MNPHYQQREKIRQNCRHKLYPQPFLIAFLGFSHKWPTFAFTGKSGYTLGSSRKIAHSGLHAETGAFRMGALLLPSERSARSPTSPGRVSERQVLPLLGLGRVCSRRTQKAFGTAMRMMRVAVPRPRGPAGLRDLFCFCRNCDLYAMRSGSFRACEAGGYHYPRRALRASETPDGRLSKRRTCRFLRSGGHH